MKKILLPVLIILAHLCYGQVNHPINTCSNWLTTPSNPSYVQVGQLNVPGNQITVEATINRTAPYNGGLLYAGDIVSKHATPSDVNYLLRPNDAEITTSNGYFRTPDVCEIELNKTYYVAMVYDGSTLKFYRNGFLMSQVAVTGNLYQNSWNTRIGFYDYQLFNTNFIGYINEVRIWNIARSQSEIRTNMNTSLPSPTTQPGLLAYYTFDDLLNKQGNPSWNGTLGGSATINGVNPDCTFIADSCSIPVSVSTIINDYTEVLGFDVCKNELIVADAAKYNPGDTVLIIQMKGAVIDSSNTSNFGTVTNYKNAGNYEFNIVKQKSGNALSLLNVLQRQYDIPTGKVQLVRVPYYKSVTISNTLTCLPWDGSKGGVLAFNVKDILTLNADIDVNGKGFIGGNGVHANPPSYNCYENEFYYPPNTDLGAGKGESIAIVSSLKFNGKGKIANGGGGGNSHNSGGGGGSNAASAGLGGYEFEGSPCDGTAPFDNRGIGGTGLLYSNPSNKIFLGGGGGAGHANNSELFYPNGGNGGGICIITANSVEGNNKNIFANGDDGLACSGYGANGCHEGMGGGGGGGTILLNINNYNSIVNANAKGGKGADMVQAGNLRVGPGGGGSGGICWLNNFAVPANINVNVTSGINGVCTNYGNSPWGTTPGQDGLSLFNLKIPIDNILFKKNIDSVRIKDSVTSCTAFDFKGLGYTNVSSITSWQWSFGDGITANTQNASHTYAVGGTFAVKLVVTDINGCKDSISKPVTAAIMNFTKSNDTSLCGSSPIQLQASGGVSYSWAPSSSLNNAGISNPVATPLSTTTYYFTVTNASGCSKMDSIKITVNNLPAVSKSNDTSICKNSTAQIFATGGTTYSWTPASSLSNAGISTPVASPNASTTYYVTVTSSAGCIKKDSVRISINPVPVITKSNDTTICKQTSVRIFANGGVSYLWSPASSLDDPTSAGPIASPSINTLYKVTITDTRSCIYYDSVNVSIKSTATFTVSPDASVCTGNSQQLQAGGGDSYLWTPSNGLDNPNISNPVATINSTNIYSVRITNNICNESAILTTQLTALQLPQVNAAKSNDITCSQPSSQLNAAGATNYTWTPASGLNNSNIANPLATPGNTTLYYVMGKDVNGCSGSDTITVKVDQNLKALYSLPNSFTPNGDGINDCFGIKYWGQVSDLDFNIYNRYGEKVFHTSDPAICWDGRYKQKLQDANIFVYIIKAKTGCGNIERKGTVALLK